MVTDEFRRQVRDALEHLYEPVCLEVHPLLAQIADVSIADRLTRAQRLRGLLKETIEALRPEQGSTSGSSAWRSYLALRYRYTQGMSMGEAANELGLSLRQMQRELRKGLDALVAVLWQRRTAAAAVGAPPQAALAGQTEELRHELDQWKLSRQPWQVQALVDDALWMLKPLLEQHGATVAVDLPSSLPPVLVDSTLTRQALYQILRLMVQSPGKSSTSLQACHDGKRVAISLARHSGALCLAEEDWHAAQLLVSQQGGTLAVETPGAGGMRIVLSLPQASQTRVLVIDDNQAIHRLFERYLTPHHYEVLHAHSGEEALQLAADAHPDLITLDVMMPSVDGWRVLRELSGRPATAHIPVAVCSVLNQPELAFALGARAYLKKPVDGLELLATLERLQGAAGLAEGASPPAPPGR